MILRSSKEIGSIGARGRKKTVLRRPLLVVALATGIAGLGVTAAMAVGPLVRPSHHLPSTPSGTSTTAPTMMGTAPSGTSTTAPTIMSAGAMGH